MMETVKMDNQTQQPRRVLQLFARLGKGGIETLVMNLYEAMDRSRVQFDFLLNIPGGEYEQRARAMGARIFYIPQRHEGVAASHKALVAFFREHARDYCAIHQHVSSLTAIVPQYYARKYHIPVRILHSHNSMISPTLPARHIHMLLHRMAKPFVRLLATNYLGCSDKALDWLYSHTGVRRQAVMVNNGIPVARFTYSPEVRAAVRRELGIHDDALVVGHTGSFTVAKNHAFLLDVFAEVVKTRPDAVLLLVGDGPLRGSIEDKIRRLGLTERVRLAGIRDDVNRLLQAVDVQLMPSLYEGLPVSLVEAQASGLPLVISDTISRDTAITPSVVFLPLSAPASAWAARVVEAARDHRRGDTSQYIRRAGFDIADTAEKLLNIYLGQ